MKFVSALITTADAVNAELTREKERLNGALPAVPGALSSTAEAKWLQTLKSTTTTSSIDKECLYTEELDRERIEKEALLAERDISGRLQAIDKEKTALKKHRDCAFHATWTLSPRSFGHSLHAYLDT